MSRPSEKARFYLEQCLPELRELERKKIFSKDEISKIVKKRSDFEHRLNSRGVQPQDFIRFVDWESNLESLRKVRFKRLGVKMPTYYAGQRRIMFIMERATRRFPADLELWIRSVDIAKQQKSYKKTTEILTSMVRLHSTRPETWIFVASYAFEDLGDIAQARSYMQRGLRFCKNSQDLWLEYFKLELGYIAKLAARRNILGLDRPQSGQPDASDAANHGTDFIGLPTITSAEWEDNLDDKQVAKIDEAKRLSNTPALAGAIPKAIFDAAMDHFKNMRVAERFFEVCASMGDVQCAKTVSAHITSRMTSLAGQSPEALMVVLQQPLVGVTASSPDFPQALGSALGALSDLMKAGPPTELIPRAISWIAPYADEELDTEVQTVISTVVARLFKLLREKGAKHGEASDAEYAELLRRLPNKPFKDLVPVLAERALEVWPSSSLLIPLTGSMVMVQ